jgi:hypothetical protein
LVGVQQLFGAAALQTWPAVQQVPLQQIVVHLVPGTPFVLLA